MKKVVALLPMKGNSVRVPRKNLRPFNGKPLYHHVMKTLLETPLVSYVVVNTDSGEIAEDIQKNFPQVKLHERPAAICGDNVPMNTILGHDISLVQDEHFVQTHSTNPLLSVKTLMAAVEKYFSAGAHDSIFSVNEHRARFFDYTGRPINHDPKVLLNTQDLNPLFEENSNFYIFSRTSFAKSGGKRIGLTPALFKTPKMESLDIDYEEDFLYAESVARSR